MAKKFRGELILPHELKASEAVTVTLIGYFKKASEASDSLPFEFSEIIDELLSAPSTVIPTVEGALEHAYASAGFELGEIRGGTYIPKLDGPMPSWILDDLHETSRVAIFRYSTPDYVEGRLVKKEGIYSGKLVGYDPNEKILKIIVGDQEKHFIYDGISSSKTIYGGELYKLGSLRLTFEKSEGGSRLKWLFLGRENSVALPEASRVEELKEPESLRELFHLKGKKVTVEINQGAMKQRLVFTLTGYRYRPKSEKITLQGENGFSVSGYHRELKLQEYRKDSTDNNPSRRRLFGLR